MPKTLEELAEMIAKRDGITYNEAMIAIDDCADLLNYDFMEGNLDAVEQDLASTLGLEPDYLDLFIF